MGELTKRVERALALLDACRVDEAMEEFHPEATLVMPGGEAGGRDAIRDVIAAFAQSFPDARRELLGAVESGDTIAFEMVVTGTQTGPYPTPGGPPMPPTGKRVSFRECDVLRFRDGKIVSLHAYFDMANILAQIGLM